MKLTRNGALHRLLVTRATRDWLDVHAFQLYLYGLAPQFDGYRIVHFTDLHLDGVMMTRARLQELVARINEQQPDLIAFTGDFITHRVPFCPDDLIIPLRDLNARDAKLAVMGNHDHGARENVVEDVIRESGMINLNNAVYSIERDGEYLHVAGVDSLTRLHARLDLVLRDLPETGTAILLAHEPDFINVSAATRRFALQLSGHTHGGQIYIPRLTR